MIFAMKMVQVSSEAKARPIMTALTRTSADRNIDQGDSSRSATAVDFSDLASDGVAVASEACGAAGRATAGPGAGAGDAVCAGLADCCGAGACCADDGWASDSIASAPITAQVTRKDDVFILRPRCG